MEIIRLSNGEGLLVEGPARIDISQGTVNLFGKSYSVGEKLVVVYGKTYPLQAISNSELKLFLGSSSKYTRVKERLIPQEWDNLVNHLLNQKRKVVMILGDEDTGKSSLALYTANKLSSQGWKTAVVDADIGQSDVGPPGVIGLCVVDAPLPTLTDVPLLSGFFIGDKSPVGHFPAMIYGTKKMVDEALNLSVKTILINTTGMIYGRHARDLKEKKIEAVSPNMVVILQREKEIEHLVTLFKNKIVILRLPVPPRIKRTSRRKRI
ncbi:MAG: hypothetical protein JSV20_05005, partial [Candidatus Bathyarchaeota archaeon]